MERMKKIRIWHVGILFAVTLCLGILMQTGSVYAADVPPGSYAPGEGQPGHDLVFTFTGDSTEACGFVANVESYKSSAVNKGVLQIPETIIYKKDSGDGNADQGGGKAGESNTNEIEVRVAGILRGAFSGCSDLVSLILPENISYIGQEAFSNCSNLATIQTAAKITNETSYITAEEIGYRAFYNCTSLVSVQLGEKSSRSGGVRTVQAEAFMNCTRLNSLEVGPTVNWIEGGAFSNCIALDGLSGLKVRNSSIFFIRNGILYFRENDRSNTLVLCPAGTQIGMLEEFPEFLTQIRSQAFYGCSGLVSIKIPNTVKSIGDRAFYNCIGLGNVTIPASVTSIGAEAFLNCSSGLCFICQSGSVAETYAISNNIPRNVECTVTFYNTVTNERTTRTVMSGGTVDLPAGWEREGYVLRWTDNFDSNTVVTADRTVSTVWKKLYTVTFRDPYSGNESVVAGVEEGTEASAPNWRRKGYKLSWSTENYRMVNADITVDAVWLVDITVPVEDDESSEYKKGDIVTVGNIIYKISGYTDKRVRVIGLENENVSKVVIPNTVSFGGRKYTVTCINASAFRGNQSITKVTISKNLRSIENYAFYNCSKLKKVVIKSKVMVNVSNYAFKRTKDSLKVYVPTKGLISTYRSALLDAGMSKKAKVKKIP